MFIEHDGLSIHYECIGEGRPLIMVHGNGEDHTIFTEAAAVLSRHYTCYLVDSRGHGTSGAVNTLHYEDMAEDMDALICTLGLENVVYYGFSDGGIVGLLLAMKNEQIRDLIISGANTTPKGVKLWIRILFKFLYLFKKDDKIRLMLEEPQIRKEDLAKIKAHTLVLAGEKDVIPEWETRSIANAIAGSTLKILAKEDHGSYIVHSTKIAEEILSFLKG